MAKAPCARLTKFISPSVTDSPTLIRNSSTPEAMPSNRIVTSPSGRGRRRAPAPRRSLLAGVLEVVDLVELDVLQLAVDAFGLADVDVLDDVAGGRLDRKST